MAFILTYVPDPVFHRQLEADTVDVEEKRREVFGFGTVEQGGVDPGQIGELLVDVRRKTLKCIGRVNGGRESVDVSSSSVAKNRKQPARTHVTM